jgi:hypothetical protein
MGIRIDGSREWRQAGRIMHEAPARLASVDGGVAIRPIAFGYDARVIPNLVRMR